ncbi:P-loop NTPase fold protein [Dactylosporangium darangshiense]|uniref:KAP NTPase domain-containing protein n=1 Tax=Dactylosporangium darangshiense TaxID=579108 RepID=A0ABP8DRR1_9ACTN
MRRRRNRRSEWKPRRGRSSAPVSHAVADQASTEDKLGFDRFVVPLADAIAGIPRSSTPWTVGIYGAWGSGKTTFLNLLQEALRDRGVTTVIRFDAWRYAREEDLWPTLIDVILDGLHTGGPVRRAVLRTRIWLRSVRLVAGITEVARKTLGFLVRIVILLSFIAIAASLVSENKDLHDLLTNAAHGIGLPQPQTSGPWIALVVGAVALIASNPMALLKVFDTKVGVDFSRFKRPRTYRGRIAMIEEFADDFHDIVALACPDRPLVVAIDDLDRCLPEQTLQILETVKLFLDVPGCVFLLAADRDIVEHAVAVKYKDLGDKTALRALGETYFEKIVQLPFSLPPPDEHRVEEYIRGLTADADVRDCHIVLRGAKPYNPRRIKRHVQMLTLLKSLAPAELGGARLVVGVLAKLVVIQSQFKDVYREAIRDPSLLAQLERHARRPAPPPGEAPPAPVDAVVEARVQPYIERHPDLPGLLCKSVGAGDSFELAPVAEYLTLVQEVTVDAVDIASAAPPASEAPERDGPARFVVAYLRDDVRWAHWANRVLADAGYIVSMSRLGEDAARLPELITDDEFPVYLVMAVSAAAIGSDAARKAVIAAGAAGARLIGIRIDQTDLPAHLPESRMLAMGGLDAAEAAVGLLSLVLAEHRVTTESGDDGARVIFPGRGARITNLRPPPSALVPRPDLIAGIEAALEAPQTSGPTVCALNGLFGVGKSTTARQYASSHASDYDVVWWVDARSAETIEASLVELSYALGGRGTGRPAVDARAALTALADGGQWLLLFDNATDPDRLLTQLPSTPGHVLVTTRRRPRTLGTVVDVPVPQSEQAVEILRAHLAGRGDSSTIGDLARGLGFLPLALVAAAGVIRATSMPVADYLTLYRRRPEDALRGADGAAPVSEALDAALAWVRDPDTGAERLLQTLALLDSAAVPRNLLLLAASRTDDLEFNRALGALAQANLIAIEDAVVTVQPLVHRLVGDRLDFSKAKLILEQIRDALARMHDPLLWPNLNAFLVHAEKYEVAAGPTAELQRRVIQYLLDEGHGADALRWAERLYPIAMALDDVIGRAHALFLLARAERMTGREDAAREHLEAARALLHDVPPDQIPPELMGGDDA